MKIFELYTNLIFSSITSLNSSQSGGKREPPLRLRIMKGLLVSIFENKKKIII